MERQRVSGFLFGVLTALCWATSPVFIRKGLDGLASSYWGVTVGLAAATGIYLAWRSDRGTADPKDHGAFLVVAGSALVILGQNL